LNGENFECFLQRSHFDYPEKATWLLRGVENVRTICQDCSLPPLDVQEKMMACCGRCPFAMMIWLLNESQAETWLELRPPDMRQKEIEKAIMEGHELSPKIKEIIGRVHQLTPLPLFLIKIICPVRSLWHKNFLRKFLCMILTG